MQRADLQPEDGRLAAKAHRTDPQPVDLLEHRFLELGQLRVFVFALERSKQLLLGLIVSCTPIGANTNTQDSRGASFPLGTISGIYDTSPDSLQVPTGLEGFVGKLVLDPYVFTPASLEQQGDTQVFSIALGEADVGEAFPDIVPGVFSRDRVYGIRSQERPACCLPERLLDLVFQPAGRFSPGMGYEEEGGTGVLAYRRGVLPWPS